MFQLQLPDDKKILFTETLIPSICINLKREQLQSYAAIKTLYKDNPKTDSVLKINLVKLNRI